MRQRMKGGPWSPADADSVGVSCAGGAAVVVRVRLVPVT